MAALNRLRAGHPILPVLAGKQVSAEAGIAGEERVADIFRKNTFPFAHHIFHDLSPTSYDLFQIDSFAMTPWFGFMLEVKNIAGILEFHENPPQLIRIPPANTIVLFPNLIPSYFRSLPQPEKKLDIDAFYWLSNELHNSHQPFIPKPICESYKIPFRDFQKGVCCTSCGRIGMIKTPVLGTALIARQQTTRRM